MASVGRRSILQALVFDPQYVQSKPKGQLLLYSSPEFMWKYQRPNQVNHPWYITAVTTGKPDFGAPNCPVRIMLRYYHRYMTEHPVLRKGRRCLFILFKDNNAGKELSAASISRWICTTIVDSHATLQNSKSITGKVKALRSVLWLLHYNFSTSRPTSSHEGQEMVQWWHLHVLLP